MTKFDLRVLSCQGSRLAVTLLGAVSCLLLPSCSRVDVYKVSRKIDDTDVVDEKISGIRFYRPRPYVSVHEPFPIHATTHFALGRLTPDGKYILLEKIAAGDQNSISLPDLPTTIDATSVRVPSAPSTDTAAAQSGAETTQSAGTPAPSTPKPTSASPDSGVVVQKSTNDPKAFSVTPARRYYDIIYLPDFDENYVVKVTQGFGNINSNVGLGQGWSLQSLDATSDNSRITEPLLDLYGDSLKLLAELGKRAVGIPPTVAGVPEAQGGATAAETFKGGQLVTIRITKVKVVAPGLYPILKPHELKALNEVYRANPKDERFVAMHVPLMNATNIAFNLYETVLIEALPASGDSTYRLLQYGGPVPDNAPGKNPTVPTSEPKSAAQLQELLKDKTGLAYTVRVVGNEIRVTDKDDKSIPNEDIKSRIKEILDKDGQLEKRSLRYP